MPELARFRAKHGPLEERAAEAAASILHVDMDAFFVSVELLERPELRGRPVVVGGQKDQRGVVTAASYEARKYGVHSAMPLRTAGRLCPHAIFLDGHHEKYGKWSDRVASILVKFSPVVEMVSIDEAYLDLAGTERLHGPPLAAADKLLRTIKESTGLPCSGGLATTRLTAKVASDQAKRPRVGSARRRSPFPSAAPGAKDSWHRRSHRESPARAGTGNRRAACGGSPGKAGKDFRAVGRGALPQSARRRFLRICDRCGTKVHLAQSHVWRRHQRWQRNDHDAQPPLAKGLQAAARSGAGRANTHTDDSLHWIRNPHARQNACGAYATRCRHLCRVPGPFSRASRHEKEGSSARSKPERLHARQQPTRSAGGGTPRKARKTHQGRRPFARPLRFRQSAIWRLALG